MKKILCLYYSGVGNTKVVAEYIGKYIEEKKKQQIDVYSIENLPQNIVYTDYDGIIIGFPTIHCSPPVRINKFIQNCKKLKSTIPIFVYTTCGLYQANTTRIFSKLCIEKNMITVLDASFRMPAIDGMLLTKRLHFLETCESNIKSKIENKCNSFLELIERKQFSNEIPRFKWYSILNYPNKFIGEHYVFPIYLNSNKCISCKKCEQNCPAKAIVLKDNLLEWDKQTCERCYRCIHHCPVGALSLSKSKGPVRIWKYFKME